jgi:hypothetical protein
MLGFVKQNAKEISWLKRKEMKKKRNVAAKERHRKRKDNRRNWKRCLSSKDSG